MNEPVDFYTLFVKRHWYSGRMVSGSKINAPKGHRCVWNANIVTKSQGKVWFGDVNITKDAPTLKAIATEAGEPLYVLKELDCRFETASDPIDVLIKKAVWNTNEP